MDELAWALTGENVHYGTPMNPEAPGCIPGGSSSGSAVAVAAGYADVGLGTDTAGSVRVPAAYNGLFGFRPTHGRVGLEGCVPLAPSFDTVGIFTRDADTLSTAGRGLLRTWVDKGEGAADDGARAIEGENRFRFSRAMMARDAFAACQPETEATLLDVLAKITAAASASASASSSSSSPSSAREDESNLCVSAMFDGGGEGDGGAWHVMEVDVGGAGGSGPTEGEKDEGVKGGVDAVTVPPLSEWWSVFRILQTREVWMAHGAWVEKHRPDFGPGVKERFGGAGDVTDNEVGRVSGVLALIAQGPWGPGAGGVVLCTHGVGIPNTTIFVIFLHVTSAPDPYSHPPS